MNRLLVILPALVVSPATVLAATLYVDNTIGPASCGNYSVAARSCGSGSETAYDNLQSAQDVANPGDIVEIRGGTFNFASRQEVVFNRSGAAGSPITYRNYLSERVVIAAGARKRVVHAGV